MALCIFVSVVNVFGDNLCITLTSRFWSEAANPCRISSEFMECSVRNQCYQWQGMSVTMVTAPMDLMTKVRRTRISDTVEFTLRCSSSCNIIF